MFENCKYKWDFIPTKEKQDAYEDMIKQLNIISFEEFNKLTDEEQDSKVAEVIAILRTRNIFPIYYFNHAGIIKEIKKVIAKNDVKFVGNTLTTQSSQGLLVLDYLFPNLHRVEAGNATNNCMYSRFYDDAKLGKCLKRHMKVYGTFSNMRTPFFMYGRFFWNTATNFAPMRAKAIFEKFCPADGIIYDYSCGFGGRMLGCLASKNNYKYIGCEPCADTYYNLLQLGGYIEEATKRKGSFEIHNACSEDLQLTPNSVDFAFSCPPFYGLERYSEEDTQSINRYPAYQDWLENYVRPTIRNCYAALKDTGLYGVDITDVTWKNKKYSLVADWCRIAAEEGFIFEDKYSIVSRSRKDDCEGSNTEQIYIFRKGELGA